VFGGCFTNSKLCHFHTQRELLHHIVQRQMIRLNYIRYLCVKGRSFLAGPTTPTTVRGDHTIGEKMVLGYPPQGYYLSAGLEVC
jgi:hypothetical protein